MTMRRTIGMTLEAVALGWVLLGTGGAANHEEPTHSGYTSSIRVKEGRDERGVRQGGTK